MPELYQSLSHSRWYCKYHVVFVPKDRSWELNRNRSYLRLKNHLTGTAGMRLPRQSKSRIFPDGAIKSI